MTSNLGQIVFPFFEDHLKLQKGFRPGSIRSYRDTLKLLLIHVASLCRRPVTRLALSDLTFERVLDFLCMIEDTRKNHVRTRNQRLAALRTFYRYLAVHHPRCWPKRKGWEPSLRSGPKLQKLSIWSVMRWTHCFEYCPNRAAWRYETVRS
jgi:integrase/recombinase XerD